MINVMCFTCIRRKKGYFSRLISTMYRIIETIELEYCTISSRDDGIVEQRFIWDQPYVITAQDIQEMDSTLKQICNGKSRCILSVPGLYGSLSQDAKKVDVFKKTGHTVAIGLIIQSLSQRLLANFFFKVNKAPFPVRFFKTEDDTTVWLHEQYKTFNHKK